MLNRDASTPRVETPSPRRDSAARPTRRSASNRTFAASRFEELERRQLLSSAVAAVTDTNLRDVTSGPMNKAGGNLINLYLQYRASTRAVTAAAGHTTFQPAATGASSTAMLYLNGNTVGVVLHTTADLKTFQASMSAIGMQITSSTPADNVVSGFLPITLLSEISQRRDVLSVAPMSPPVTHQQGVANNQADTTMKATNIRNAFNLRGRGVTIGVLSDSANQLGNGLADSVTTGDLPSDVNLIKDGPFGGTDEGRAMLEEIHDLAPASKLAFATADGGQQTFADDITKLQNAGAKVIVDDVGYLDEPNFQPGVIDKAINAAVAAGVTYVSAAGNSAGDGFEQKATWVPATSPTGTSDYLINFNPGGVQATRMNITIGTGGIATFQWDDQFDGLVGHVKSDLDIYFYSADGTSIVTSSTDNNFATGRPLEQFNLNPGTYQVEIRAKNTPTASLPTYYSLMGNQSIGIDSTQYAVTRASVAGHSGNANIISTGAVASIDAPPYSAVTPITTETFSSLGPVVHTRDQNGLALSTPVTLQKPDVSGIDDVTTSFFASLLQGPILPTNLPRFSGTSAAAPNVAAVVALLLEAHPNASGAQILQALKTTATPLNGKTAGVFDPAGGFGLVDASAALASLSNIANAPSVTIEPIVPNPISTPVQTIRIDFNQKVTGFDIGDLQLTLDGGTNLLSSSQKLTTTDGQHYLLTNLSGITFAPGAYILSLTPSGIVGNQSQPLATGATIFFTKTMAVEVPAQPTKLSAQAVSQGSIRISFHDNATNEDGYTVQRSADPTFATKVTTLTFPANTTHFTDGGLAAGTRYYYRVFAQNSIGDSAFSGVATSVTLSKGEIIIDNSDATGVTIKGAWTASHAIPGFLGRDYLQDDNTGKGTKSVTYSPALKKSGQYFVYARWTTANDRAKQVPVDIFSKTSLLQTTFVDERNNGGVGWVLLGKFNFHSGASASVRIRNKGTKGEVIADAVRFLPANAFVTGTASPTATPAFATAAFTRSAFTVPSANQKTNPLGFSDASVAG